MFQTTDQLVSHVKRCIELAEEKRSNLPEKLAAFEGGMSGEKIRHLLNNLCCFPSNYLEIGVFNGSTFIPAMWENRISQGVAVDNWCEFDGNGRLWFLKHIDDFLSDHPAIRFLEQDCFTVKEEQLFGKIDIYFYDGCHARSAQKQSLVQFWPFMADRFVFIVDDWNAFEVQYGTADAVRELETPPVFAWTTKTTDDGTYKVDGEASANWWQGLGVFVFDKTNKTDDATKESETK